MLFNKKVYIRDDSLLVGKRKIYWHQIVGMKQFSGKLVKYILPDYPIIELFLANGRVIIISSTNKIVNETVNADNSVSPFNLLVDHVRSHATLRPIFSNWLKWRVIFPSLFIQIVVTTINLLIGSPFDSFVETGCYAGALFLPIGWLWEIKARGRRGTGGELGDVLK